MKVSDLIIDIVELAEGKFDIDEDTGYDGISVSIFYHFDNETFENSWQVCLTRPTEYDLGTFLDTPKEQLVEDLESIDILDPSEVDNFFFVERPTLVEALKELYNRVDNCAMANLHRSRFVPVENDEADLD